MATFILTVLAVIAVALDVTYASTAAEVAQVRAAIRPILDDCGKEFGITREQILAAKAEKNIDKFEPCFYACFFKKIGFIDSNGLFDAKVAIEKNMKHFKGEDDIKKTEQIGETCSSVNEQTVIDEDKGCERSKLLVTCFLKEDAKIFFTPFDA